MILEFDLQGSKCRHKGIFDSTGFWVRFEPEIEVGAGEKVFHDDGSFSWRDLLTGYKIFSHFSFAFFHEEEQIAREVYEGLCKALSGIDWAYPGIGFIREVC